MSDWDDPDELDADAPGGDERGGLDRAPICPACGVTALPGELAHVIDTTFVCANDECEANGEVVG